MATIYELRDRGQVIAVLWQGKAADLADLPNFNQLVGIIIKIDSTGMLILEIDSEKCMAEIGRSYVIYNPSTGFDIVPKAEFEKRYEAVPQTERSKWDGRL